MCPNNINNDFNLLSYLEHTVNNTYYFEYYMYQEKAISSEEFSVDRLLDSQTLSFSLNTDKDVKRVFLENYYYDIEITDTYCKTSFLVDPNENKQFFEDLSLDMAKTWYINISINHNETKIIADSFSKSKRLLEKLENLKKSLLKVYIKGEVEEENYFGFNNRFANTYRDWLSKKNEHKTNLDFYLERENFDENDVNGFDVVIKSIIPNFSIDKGYKWDKLTSDDVEAKNMLLEKYRNLRELLQKTKAYEQYSNVDLVEIYIELLGFDGIGEVAMSILLNTINNKHFPIYTRGLSRYMKMVGFEIESDEILDKYEKIAVKYNNYQVGINQMFLSFGNYLNDHKDSYDAVNYYFRKKLDLFEL